MTRKKQTDEEKSDWYFNYHNTERAFIIQAIGRKFKPSVVSEEKVNFARKTFSSYTKLWVPELTREEMWAELTLHIQRMKDKHPESDGRLCRICEKPWTYERSRPENGVIGSGVSGGKAKRKQVPTNFSVDRFDSNQTYKKGNIIFVCLDCNKKKNASEKWMWIRLLEIDKELENERRFILLSQKD